MNLFSRNPAPRKAAKIFASLVLAAIAGLAPAQVFEVYKGHGVLENAWNDYSWCSDDLANTAVLLTGHAAIKVTYTAAWQGFYLNSSTPFSAGDFTALTFYIDGGATANRSITVTLVVNGNPTKALNLNSYISGGHVPAKSWSAVTIPLSAFGLKSTDQISGFWLQESSGAAQPAYWLDDITWAPKPPPTTTTIQVNATTTAKTITPLMFGVNTAVWTSNLDTTRCKALIASAGFKGFRFPGGSLSDGYDWQTNAISTGGTWPVDFDQFADVAAPYGGQDVITVNYGTGTPALAANWVKYANTVKKYGMKYWEVGNEVYGSWETDSHAKPNDPVTYATEFAQYYQQMKAQSPTILVGAVATPGEDAFANYASTESVTNPVTQAKHSGWTPVMLANLAKLGVHPDFIIYHRYPEYDIDCDYTLLAGDNGFSSDIADLQTQLNDYLGAAAKGVQIFCTEINSNAGPEGKQMTSLVNGLFLADSFGCMLKSNAQAMLWWDLMNGIDTTGDNGIYSPDLTKIYPMFYIEQLLNLFATPGDKVTNATSTYDMLTVYATKRADGSVRLLVVNKNPTATLSASINLAGITPAATAKVYTFGIPEDNEAKNSKPQSITASSLSNVSATTTVSFAPYSATVFVFTPKSSA
jgi:hypothetical protein